MKSHVNKIYKILVKSFLVWGDFNGHVERRIDGFIGVQLCIIESKLSNEILRDRVL